MLIINRKRNQTIRIGDDIIVIITETSRSSVSIGIQAPKNFIVVRGEIYEQGSDQIENQPSNQNAKPNTSIKPTKRKEHG